VTVVVDQLVELIPLKMLLKHIGLGLGLDLDLDLDHIQFVTVIVSSIIDILVIKLQ
jgi:hypothetical protein